MRPRNMLIPNTEEKDIEQSLYGFPLGRQLGKDLSIGFYLESTCLGPFR
jgi:hypothetical protein